MPEELDPAIAGDLAESAVFSLPRTPARTVLCTKRQLQACLVDPVQQAYAMGFHEQRGGLAFAACALHVGSLRSRYLAPDRRRASAMRLASSCALCEPISSLRPSRSSSCTA